MKWAFYVLLAVNAAFFSWRIRGHEPPAPPAEPALPAQVDTLLMLREIDREELRERVVRRDPSPPAASASPSAAPAPPPEDPARACFAVGPLTDESRAEVVRAWLEERSGVASLRAQERRELARYWVYFPPFLSRGAAVQRVNEMRASGIDDIYIITRGDMSNAISLGVYSLQTSLDRRLGELKQRGYEPSVVPRYRTTKASWFDVVFPAPFEFPVDEFTARFPGTEASDAPCPSPADGLRASGLPDARATDDEEPPAKAPAQAPAEGAAGAE